MELLNSSYHYNIATLGQLQNQDRNAIISHTKFKQKYKNLPKTINDALNQVISRFPPHNPTQANTNSNKTKHPPWT